MFDPSEKLLHEWDDEDDPRQCEVCGCTYLDSGHFDRTDEECPARLRDALYFALAKLEKVRQVLNT